MLIQAGDIGDTQHQSIDADPQDVTDVEVEEVATDEAGDEPPTILPEAKPRAKARPIRKLTSNKMSSDESVDDKSVGDSLSVVLLVPSGRAYLR